jgi:NAD(P)H-hydrate repair Nnr-like enzyme with NAD(P)H-hydrate dehydratase domain
MGGDHRSEGRLHAVCDPTGKVRFNTTGNAGMAKGGER